MGESVQDKGLTGGAARTARRPRYRPGQPGCPVALTVTQACLTPVPLETGLPAGESESVAGLESHPKSLYNPSFPHCITAAPNLPSPESKAMTELPDFEVGTGQHGGWREFQHKIVLF